MNTTRRSFIKTSAAILGGSVIGQPLFAAGFNAAVPVSGHLWVYASHYPPNWDCAPVLADIFSDFNYAGMQGLELMEVLLRHDDAVQRLTDLVGKYKVAVTGTSYNASMWDKAKHKEILEDIDMVTQRLHTVGGITLGISVGDAGRLKTEQELDAQADVLKSIIKLCAKNKIEPNLHNHTYEVKDNLHDLKGTLARIPDVKLGPDLNWLVRGGVDPVWFIETYGHQMVYMHIRDQKADGKWTEAVGEGVIDFPAIVKALKKADFKGRAAIELAFDAPPVNAVKDDWKKSREYVKNVFGW